MKLTEDMTWEDARQLVGQPYEEGRIIGITSRPDMKHKPGIYLTIAYTDKPCTHIKVGEEK